MISTASSAGKLFKKVIFITGTDTGVGKTMLTGLLLFRLRQTGCHALAMKPFCSGGRADVNFLFELQGGDLHRDEINPYYFPEPIAPLVSSRMHRRRIKLAEVVKRIQEIAARCDRLIVEGSGGLLVPLGEGYTVADLIAKLNCPVIVVARNRLGTINHTLLTVGALRALGLERVRIVLMDKGRTDFSGRSNQRILAQLVAPAKLWYVPFLGRNAQYIAAVKRNCRKVKKTLAQLADADTF
jgi:dethiobiotin synthetase